MEQNSQTPNVPLYLYIQGHTLALKGIDKKHKEYLKYDCSPTCCSKPDGLQLLVTPQRAQKLRKDGG